MLIFILLYKKYHPHYILDVEVISFTLCVSEFNKAIKRSCKVVKACVKSKILSNIVLPYSSLIELKKKNSHTNIQILTHFS